MIGVTQASVAANRRSYCRLPVLELSMLDGCNMYDGNRSRVPGSEGLAGMLRSAWSFMSLLRSYASPCGAAAAAGVWITQNFVNLG